MSEQNNCGLQSVPSAGRLRWLRERRRTRRAVQGLRAALLAGFFLFWELAARHGWIDPFIFSSPGRIWQTLCSLAGSGDLWLHTGTSVLETVAGFTLGTLAGILIATLLWWSPFLARVLDPYLVV
ncbi:MAG: ABC transporter permease, partial [Butyricicoccaceae bacterium]